VNSIVVDTDGSETAALAVREAADIASSLGAHVHIVSVFQPLYGVTVAGAASSGASRTRSRTTRTAAC
jgi:nucleotide-binding universal stress UspA family protein